MALLSDREGFDRAAMQKVEMDMLKQVMATVEEAPGGLVVHEADYDVLDLALQAARRLTKNANPYNRRGAWNAVWAIEQKIATF